MISHKNFKEFGFADVFLVEHTCLSKLDKVEQLVDWHKIDSHLSDILGSKIDESVLFITYDVQSSITATMVLSERTCDGETMS